MEREAKAKVVASLWGSKFVHAPAALAVLPRSIWKKRLDSSYSSKSTKAKRQARQGIEQILPPKQTRRPLHLLFSPSFFNDVLVGGFESAWNAKSIRVEEHMLPSDSLHSLKKLIEVSALLLTKNVVLTACSAPSLPTPLPLLRPLSPPPPLLLRLSPPPHLPPPLPISMVF